MQGGWSHGSLKSIFRIVALPAVMGFISGAWFMNQTADPASRADAKRATTASSEVRLLVDGINQQIDSLRHRAWVLDRDGRLENFGPVLFFGKLQINGDKVQGVKQILRNPSWTLSSGSNPVMADSYMNIVLSRLSPAHAYSNGIDFLRVKQDPSGGSELFCFAFVSPTSNTELLAVWVDPSTFFPEFSHWERTGTELSSRGYLVGGDGLILAHSQKDVVYSDLSSTPLYKEGVEKALNDPALANTQTGEFESLDHLPVTAAYLKLEKLPLVAVVEEVSRPALGWITVPKFWISAGLSFLFLTVLSLCCSFYLRDLWRRSSEDLSPDEVLAPQVQSRETQETDLGSLPLRESLRPSKDFLNSDELFILGVGTSDTLAYGEEETDTSEKITDDGAYGSHRVNLENYYESKRHEPER